MIPLYKPFMPDLPLMDEILHSGKLAYGKYGKEFESILANYFSNDKLIVTNTYNMAILVALTTLGLKSGDSILASPMACLASTQPLLSIGLKIIWADINPETGTLDPDSVLNKVKRNINIKAILHNHFCGYVGFIDEINTIGNNYGIPVIDDGIEAFGSEYKGKKIGNVGTDITIFSFNPVRLPNTLDGGVVIFKDKQLFEKSILVRDAGINRKYFRDDIGEINPECDIEIIGHSATPMEPNAYIGTQQMKYIDELLSIQRRNAKTWEGILKIFKEIKPIENAHGLPNYWVFGTLANNKKESMLHFREKGFFASGVHLNNNIYSVFGKSNNLTSVDKFQKHFLALPCGWWVEEIKLDE